MASTWEPSKTGPINGGDLPAKSYAEAAVEPPPPKTNGARNGNTSNQSDYNAVKSPGEYEGSGILDVPTSPVRGHKKLGSRSSRSSLKTNGVKKGRSNASENNELVYEEYQDGKGGQLTSLKPSEDYERALKTYKKEGAHTRKGEQELASGRVAAAGWERSG